MQHENTKPRVPASPGHISPRSLNILLQLLHRILQRSPRIVHLIDNQYILANKTRHLQRRQVKPLGTCNFCSWCFNRLAWVTARGEGFVKGQTDGLDWDIRRGWAFEEGAVCCQRYCVCTERQKGSYRVICKLPEYPGWNISSSSDGDHEIGMKDIEDMLRGCLAEFVDLKLGLLAAIYSGKEVHIRSLHASRHI